MQTFRFVKNSFKLGRNLVAPVTHTVSSVVNQHGNVFNIAIAPENYWLIWSLKIRFPDCCGQRRERCDILLAPQSWIFAFKFDYWTVCAVCVYCTLFECVHVPTLLLLSELTRNFSSVIFSLVFLIFFSSDCLWSSARKPQDNYKCFTPKLKHFQLARTCFASICAA